MKSDVLSGDGLNKLKNAFFDDLLSFSSSIDSGSISIIGTSSIISVGWADCFRAFIDSFKDNEAAIKNLIISSLSSLSRTCPNAIELYLRAVIDNLDISGFHRPSRVSSKDLLHDILCKNGDRYIDEYSEYLIQSLDIAGSTGHINVRINDSARIPEVSLDQGFKARCFLDDFFIEHLDNFVMESCKILVVDGKVMDIGEIHHVLQSSYDTKQEYIIITTGLSEDVSNTLFVNWSTGKTNVIPFHVSDSVDSINEIKDICVASGVTPCSAKNGKILSSVDLGLVPECKVQYTKDSLLTISPPALAHSAVNKLRSEIRKKIEECTAPDVRELLQSRLSKLCLRNVTLQIPGESQARGILEDKINVFFSHISRCGSQGVIDVRELYYKDYHTKFLPSHDAMLAIKRARSDRKVIDNIRAIIKLEHDK